jgi:hypothetical protein
VGKKEHFNKFVLSFEGLLVPVKSRKSFFARVGGCLLITPHHGSTNGWQGASLLDPFLCFTLDSKRDAWVATAASLKFQDVCYSKN